MRKQDGRRLSPTAQEAIRRRLVSFLKSRQGTQKQAAAIFQLSLRAVEKIWKRYRQGGTSALKVRKRGPQASTARLTGTQAAQIKKEIRKHTPDYDALPYSLWTADAVRRLIKKKQALLTAHAM